MIERTLTSLIKNCCLVKTGDGRSTTYDKTDKRLVD